MPKLIDLAGQKFGQLQVIEIASRGHDTRWRCRCVCGNECLVPTSGLISGGWKSCGCWNRERIGGLRRTHGMSRQRVYTAWLRMRVRCLDPDSADFHRYGGRGIAVCERWLQSFENFLADMGLPPEGTSLERKDNNGPYTPENCKWALKEEQANNTRANRYVTFRGETHTVSEWARRLNMSRTAIAHRLRHGWSAEDALTYPVRGAGNEHVHYRNAMTKEQLAALGRKGALARWRKRTPA